ncbi:hypothetical protein [Devosia sp. SL43]|uniref:hypothetical protein n=1 Tax=Devosia sp. SL43 TaxID=2806348 RepID=UPI001F1EFA5C|nr:hypothetical protein [Devosia sp. SL43]UJW84632.1 hypothetical protein IM737_14530 [Devosia sp. SL43]
MIAESTRLEHAPSAGDLGWICRSMVFSWRGSEPRGDAAELFADVFGFGATNAHRNKFPTASMPCRSWARGMSDGIAVDLRIGVDNDHSQLRLLASAKGEPVPSALAQFRVCVERLEAAAAASLVNHRAVLDLELPDKADHAGFLHWLGHEDWQAHARLFRQEYVFAPGGGNTELSIAASVDRRTDKTRLTVGVAFPATPDVAGSAELFETIHLLLATGRIADLATV